MIIVDVGVEVTVTFPGIPEVYASSKSNEKGDSA